MGLFASRNRGGSGRHVGIEGIAGVHGAAALGDRGFGLRCAFYFLSLTLNAISVGIAYALWSGIGIVFITAVGWLWFGQALDTAAMLGIALIVAGVGVINLFSNAAAH